MDKYEFNIKVEQLKKLVGKNDFETAMKIADTIDWRRVRNTNLLSMVATVYEKNRDYEEAKEILLLAYERAPIGKRLLYKLAELAAMEGNVDEAEAYYREFSDLAQNDPRQQLLRYMILKAKGAPIQQLIHSLESYTSLELDEEWLYELAELYSLAGMQSQCVDTCDKIMLMFGLGKYVEKAMELKMRFAPLTTYQMDLVDNRDKYEAKLRAVEEEYRIGGRMGAAPLEEEYYDGPTETNGQDVYRNDIYAGGGYENAGYADVGYMDNGYSSNGYSGAGEFYGDNGYGSNGGYANNSYAQNTSFNDTGYEDTGYAQEAGYEDTGYAQEAGYGDTGYAQEAGYGDTGYAQEAGYGDTGYNQNDNYSDTGYDRNAGYRNNGYAQEAGYSHTGYAQDSDYTDNGYARNNYSNTGYAPNDGYTNYGYLPTDGYAQTDGYADDGYAQTDSYAVDGYLNNDTYNDNGYAADGFSYDGDDASDPGYASRPYENDNYAAGGYTGNDYEAGGVTDNSYVGRGHGDVEYPEDNYAETGSYRDVNYADSGIYPDDSYADEAFLETPYEEGAVDPGYTGDAVVLTEDEESDYDPERLYDDFPDADTNYQEIEVRMKEAEAQEKLAKELTKISEMEPVIKEQGPKLDHTRVLDDIRQVRRPSAPGAPVKGVPTTKVPSGGGRGAAASFERLSKGAGTTAQSAASAVIATVVAGSKLSEAATAATSIAAAQTAVAEAGTGAVHIAPTMPRPKGKVSVAEPPKGGFPEPAVEERHDADRKKPPIPEEDPDLNIRDLNENEEPEDTQKFLNHLMIEARSPEKGLQIAIEALKQIHKETGVKNPVAKITGSKLSKRGVLISAEKLAGKDLIIEEAGDLTKEALDELNELMNKDTTGMLVVLIDNPKQMESLHSDHPVLASKFECIGGGEEKESSVPVSEAPSTIPVTEFSGGKLQEEEYPGEKLREKELTADSQMTETDFEATDFRPEEEEEPRKEKRAGLFRRKKPVYEEMEPEEEEPYEDDYYQVTEVHSVRDEAGPGSNGEEMDIDEFAQYACKYAGEIDCSITGKSMLALYERIEILEEDGVLLTRTNAEELIEEAADRAEKPSIGKRIKGLFSSKYDKDGLLILKEEHFIY